jgi:hypothetical protein
MLDSIPLQRSEVIRIAELSPQFIEDGPVALLPLVPDVALQVALEIAAM